MRIRLTRRLASSIDGIDLSARRVGDVFDLTGAEGELLIAEGWAMRIAPRTSSASARSGTAAGTAESERRHTRVAEDLRRLQQQIRGQAWHLLERRRAEDRIREAWHDEHAVTFPARRSTRPPPRPHRR